MSRKTCSGDQLRWDQRAYLIFPSSGWLWSLKSLSLAVLTVQNATLILMMRYSRTRPGDLYITSTAVMLTEIVKVVLSALMLLAEEKSIIGWLKYLYANTIGQPLDMLKMAVPACIYTIQNNLLYIALSNLDAATYQVNIRSAALGSRKWGMGWGGGGYLISSPQLHPHQDFHCLPLPS